LSKFWTQHTGRNSKIQSFTKLKTRSWS